MPPRHRHRSSFVRVLAFALGILVAATMVARAQSPADAEQTVTVAVMPFEFAAPLNATPHRPPRWPLMRPPLLHGPSGIGVGSGFAPRLAHARSAELALHPAASQPIDESAERVGDPIGVGIADLVVARLLEVPGFRVVERRRLDLLREEQTLVRGDSLTRRDSADLRSHSAAILRARYIITGSVTRFGTEERRGLGGLGGAFGLGGLGLTRPKTQVALTARIVDVTTGEIVASITGAGVSRKGGSILLGGGGGGVGGGVVLTSSEFRASALGEATERAVGQLVERIVARRGAMR